MFVESSRSPAIYLDDESILKFWRYFFNLQHFTFDGEIFKERTERTPSRNKKKLRKKEEERFIFFSLSRFFAVVCFCEVSGSFDRHPSPWI